MIKEKMIFDQRTRQLYSDHVTGKQEALQCRTLTCYGTERACQPCLVLVFKDPMQRVITTKP